MDPPATGKLIDTFFTWMQVHHHEKAGSGGQSVPVINPTETMSHKSLAIAFTAFISAAPPLFGATGVGAKPIDGAEVIIDGTRETLDQKWTYWEGPGFKSAMPIKWKIVEDPVDKGGALQTDDRAADGGKYGAADIVTKKPYRDFRLHVEFLIMKPGGNSGVYLQNRYEIQVLDGDKTKHGMGAVINETESPYHVYNGLGKWNSYDIVFRAARFKDGKLSEKARLTMYFNGIKVHTNQTISQVWGGAKSGIDGGNDGGKGITDTPGGLKLQCEGHDVRYRNTWIKELDLKDPDTDFDAAE
jgi:hypothetical protein